MSQNTTNILVGAANVALGSYGGTGQLTGDAVYALVRAAVTGTPKDYRAWVLAQDGSATLGSGSTIAFSDVGLTSGGVEVQYQPDFGEVEVDQVLDAAKLFKQKMSVMVNTTFAEATLENLLVTWSQGPDTLQVSVDDNSGNVLYLAPGALGEAPQEKAILFVGNSPNTNTAYGQRVYMAARAISVQSSAHRMSRSEATTFPVSFRLLPDTASSYSAYGRVVDVV